MCQRTSPNHQPRTGQQTGAGLAARAGRHRGHAGGGDVVGRAQTLRLFAEGHLNTAAGAVYAESARQPMDLTELVDEEVAKR